MSLSRIPKSTATEQHQNEHKNSHEKITTTLSKRKEPESDLATSSKKIKTSPASPVFLQKTNTEAAIAVHGPEPINFKGQDYVMLSRALVITPVTQLTSCGGSSREMIFADMQTERLKKYFEDFLESSKVGEFKPVEEVSSQEATQPLDEDLSEAKKETAPTPKPYQLEILQALVAHVRTSLKSTTEAELNDLIAQESQMSSDKPGKPAPLEWFLKFNRGLCRHFSLLTACLLVHWLDYFAKKNKTTYPDSKNRVYHFRTKLQPLDEASKPISHAVIIYEAENGRRYLLDATRSGPHHQGLVVDLTNLSTEDQNQLAKHYHLYQVTPFIQEIKQVYDKLAKPELELEPASSLGASPG